jgi:predicted transcriptional regulator
MADQSMDRAATLSAVSAITAAWLSNNVCSASEVSSLISSVYHTVNSLVGGQSVPERVPEPASTSLVPAVPVKKSVFPDFIICLEDGKRLKMLKRHLAASYGMSPEQYRTKWNLPKTYPMVAPNYAEQRSSLAKKIGLGRPKTTEEQATDPGAPAKPMRAMRQRKTRP